MHRTVVPKVELLTVSELQKLAALLTDTNQTQRIEGIKFLKELGGVERLFHTVVAAPEKSDQEQHFNQLIKSIFSSFTGGLDYVHPKTQLTCLVYAISVSSLIGVSRTLRMGANPNFVLPDGYTALYYCCAAKSSSEDNANLKKRTSQIMIELRKYGADPNQSAHQGNQFPLINLVSATAKDCLIADCETFLEIFPNINVNVRSSTRVSPLFAAAWSGNSKIVARLLKLGADVNAENDTHMTPLMGAIKSHSWDSALLLLNAGAGTEISIKYQGENGDEFEASPLLAVIELYLGTKNSKEKIALINLIKLLLNRQADPYRLFDNTASVLTKIIQADSNELFDCMVAAGIDFNRVCHTYNKTALMLACQMGRMTMVKRMAATGTDITHKTADNRSALFYACVSGNSALVNHLLHPLRAYIDMADHLGFTPLYSAAQVGNTQIMKCLLQNGATITAEKLNNQTPLHAAAKHGHIDALRLLVLHTRNKKEALNAVTKQGATALMIASMYGHLDMVKLLVENGADPNIKLASGGNALYIAYGGGYRKVCEYLYIQIYCRDMLESGMEIECRLIEKMLGSHDDDNMVMKFNLSFKPTLFAASTTSRDVKAGTSKTDQIATESDVISSFRFLREQGFSADEIKKMQKKIVEPSPSTSSSSTTSSTMEKYTWLQNSIDSTSAEVMKIESDQSGNACFLYFDKISLAEQGCDFTEELTKFRCKFAPQENASGMVKLRGKPLEVEIKYGNETSPQYFKDEYKFKDTDARILCYRITSDNGRATLFVGCLFAANGLHQTSDRTRLNNKIALHLPEVKLSPGKVA